MTTDAKRRVHIKKDEVAGEPRLDIDLSDPGGLPDESISGAVALMKSGRLHRYGEYKETEPHAALLEAEYAEYMGAKYAVAVNSGGCALFLALKVAGVKAGDAVLVNAFNLAPVPGAIEHAGGAAVLVEVDADYHINFADLTAKAASLTATASGVKVLLLTHMRGHIADMDRIMSICEKHRLTLIEDCAHTMGAAWRGKLTGSFGAVGCFSTQTFKHINSGEGGIIVTDDEDLAAKAILYSGSYMLYGQHHRAPPARVFDKWKKHIPNYSLRMSNLSACILRPQLRQLNERAGDWNRLYAALATRLNAIAGVQVPMRDPNEQFVASSIQFSVSGLSADKLQQFQRRCTACGVAIKWFGRAEPMGYTSQYHHWEYLQPQSLPQTTEVLSTTCDMRIPLSLTEAHCDLIAATIKRELENLLEVA